MFIEGLDDLGEDQSPSGAELHRLIHTSYLEAYQLRRETLPNKSFLPYDAARLFIDIVDGISAHFGLDYEYDDGDLLTFARILPFVVNNCEFLVMAGAELGKIVQRRRDFIEQEL